jgi:hypothetical protein
MPSSALKLPNTAQGDIILRMLQSVAQNPLIGATIEHYFAQYVDDGSFTKYGQIDYLAQEVGQDQTGIKYVANPKNPIRGVFCSSGRRPVQDKGGIRYEAQPQIILLEDPGEVYSLDPEKPKRQDKFIVSGRTYYATAPAFPCQMGDTIAAFKIDLALERYPVTN